MEMGGCVGGTILYLVLSAIQLACVNSPVFRVENNIGKLVFWRDVSYFPKLTSLWQKSIYSHYFILNLMRLVHAMRSNGPSAVCID
jgi:HD-like signal output (HDOD) protein